MMRLILKPELSGYLLEPSTDPQNVLTQRRKATSSWAVSAKPSLLFRTFTATCFFLLGNEPQLSANACQWL